MSTATSPCICSKLPEAAPSLSAEVFAIPLDDRKYILYAPLRRAAFVANAAAVNFLADLKDGRYDRSLDTDRSLVEFLRRLEILDAGPELPPITTVSGDPMPTTVTLFLTTACNLRCTYCYASAGDLPLKRMSLKTAKWGIDFIASNAVKKRAPRFEIAYHGGGEPSMNWRVMTESLKYAGQKAEQLGLFFTASCATNGLLRDERIDWIITHLNGVSLSFDGLPEVHDRHRPTPQGSGSSARVIHTLRRFDVAGFNYGIRVTVTRDQILNLPDSIEYICSNFRPRRIQVEPAYQLGRWKNAPAAETEVFIAAFRRAQQRATEHGQAICFSASRLDMLTNHFCGVTQDSFALSPDGNVSACYEAFSEQGPLADVFFYGKSDTGSGGYSFELPVLNNLRGQAVQHREFCRGCFAKWHCAGDCYHRSLSVNGRGEFAGSDRCHITRELTKDQILSRITAAGGLFWHEFLSEALASQPHDREVTS